MSGTSYDRESRSPEAGATDGTWPEDDRESGDEPDAVLYDLDSERRRLGLGRRRVRAGADGRLIFRL